MLPMHRTHYQRVLELFDSKFLYWYRMLSLNPSLFIMHAITKRLIITLTATTKGYVFRFGFFYLLSCFNCSSSNDNKNPLRITSISVICEGAFHNGQILLFLPLLKFTKNICATIVFLFLLKPLFNEKTNLTAITLCHRFCL